MTKLKEAIVATTQEAVQISAIVPTLTVDDLQKSITFYEALGFAIDDRWEEKGTLLGVMLLARLSEVRRVGAIHPQGRTRTVLTCLTAALRDRPSPDADVQYIHR